MYIGLINVLALSVSLLAQQQEYSRSVGIYLKLTKRLLLSSAMLAAVPRMPSEIMRTLPSSQFFHTQWGT